MRIESGIVDSFDDEKAAVARSALRVGGIDYLNALPLTAYLGLDGGVTRVSHHPLRIELRNLVPSALARGLRSGELDVALVPVVEYLESDDYRVIPDICISSYGPVESIRLYHQRPLAAVRRVGLDSCSRTSAMLTRLFFRTQWRGTPDFIDIQPDAAQAYLDAQNAGRTSPWPAEDLDAVLLIGDAALDRGAPAGWRITDLGNEWTRLTGLPFVYAFWVWRGPAVPRGLVEYFQNARELGLSHIDEIVRRFVRARAGARDGPGAVPDTGFPQWNVECRWREYLSRVIQYDLGPLQIEGLSRFFSLLGGAGLHDRASRPLKFVDDSF